MDSSEVRWTPHLISIQLVRTSVLVPILSLVNTFEECVSGFEAEFLVPSIVVEVACGLNLRFSEVATHTPSINLMFITSIS